MPRRPLATVFMLCLGALACHTPPAGSTPNGQLPTTVVVGGQALALNGSARYQATVFAIDIFVVALYLEKVTTSADEAARCDGAAELDYDWIYPASRNDLADPWRDKMRENAGPDLAVLGPRIDQLVAALRGVDKGDVWRFIYTPADGLAVVMNGTPVVKIPGQDFCHFVSRPARSAPHADADTRKGLLAGGH